MYIMIHISSSSIEVQSAPQPAQIQNGRAAAVVVAAQRAVAGIQNSVGEAVKTIQRMSTPRLLVKKHGITYTGGSTISPRCQDRRWRVLHS
jgi:hypothetical protein